MVILRSFDRPYYRPLEPILVTIRVTPDSSVKAYAIEEDCPATWIVSGIDNGGTSFPGTVKFGVFFDSVARTFHYTITPPVGENKIGNFSGNVSFDGVSNLIQGSQNIGLDRVPPAPPK